MHLHEGFLEADALVILVACYFLDIDAAVYHGGGSLWNDEDVVALGCQSNSDARNCFGFAAARSSCEADFTNIGIGTLGLFDTRCI